MALNYIYMIQPTMQEYHGMVEWAGIQKWKAQEYLKEQLEDGLSLDMYKVTRMKDGQSHTRQEVDVYEFMNIDLGETL